LSRTLRKYMLIFTYMNKSSSNNSKIAVLVTINVVAVLAIIAYFYFQAKHELPKAVSINTANQPFIGKSNAPVHIVVFEDLKCPNCKRFNNYVYPTLKKKFIDTGIAKYTFFNLAFLYNSMPAANTARCLYAQNKAYFFPFIEYIYHNQPPETENWATIPRLLQFAKAAVPKANLESLSNCMIEGRYNTFIQKNNKEAEKIMKEVAAPTIYVNGIKAAVPSLKAVTTLINLTRK
jgi:protein-disulfide isomerase